MNEQTRKNLEAILDKTIAIHYLTDWGLITIPYDEIMCRYCDQHFRSECVCGEKINL